MSCHRHFHQDISSCLVIIEPTLTLEPSSFTSSFSGDGPMLMAMQSSLNETTCDGVKAFIYIHYSILTTTNENGMSVVDNNCQINGIYIYY